MAVRSRRFCILVLFIPGSIAADGPNIAKLPALLEA
jgi:hypothetical protein